MTNKRDPTRSARLRRHGRALVSRRVFELHRSLRLGLQENDAAGLRTRETTAPPLAFINWMESASSRMARAENIVAHFVEQALLLPEGWPHNLIEQSVLRGIEQVEQELRTVLGHLDYSDVSTLHARAATSEVEGIAGETKRRLLRLVLHALETKIKPEALMRNVRDVLEKVTRVRLNLMVNTGVVRAVNAGKLFAYANEGITQVGIDPEWVQHRHHHDSVVTLQDANKTRKAKVRERKKANKARRTQRRSKLSAEARILKAAFPAAGAVIEAIERAEEVIEQVTLVGVLTAGDDEVCEECQDIAADGPYDLDTARGLIPAHPNCRCAFIPFGDARFAAIEEQEQ